jgi:hypothetical protein
MSRFHMMLVSVFIPYTVGCSAAGTSAATSALVSNAVAQAQTTHEAAKSCFDAFQTCVDQASTADAITACQATLAACLPTQSGISDTPPDICSEPPADHRGHDCDGDGGMGPDRGPPPSGAMPPPGDAHSPPDGGAPPEGRGPGGGGPHHGPGFPVSPATHIALATCHAELHKCLAAGTDRTTCIAADHQCVHDALVADFTQLCATLGDQCANCATSTRCAELATQCAAGVPLGDQPSATTTTTAP